MPTDTSEKGLESLIVASLTGRSGQGVPAGTPSGEHPPAYENAWYTQGDPNDFDREHAVDLAKLLEFLKTTQSDAFEALGLASEGHRRQAFLHRLQGEIAKRGIVEVLRRGVKDGPHSVSLFYGTPSAGNAKAEVLYRSNIFSVTRQLKYSRDESQLALDLGLFINGLPVATFELKNSLTKQTYGDAIVQYKRDRDPRELLFQFGRCLVHFAVDDQQVWMCTRLLGKASWFLPFNKGWNDGAGNPPNVSPTGGGLKTEYLWRKILTRSGWTDILENYAQLFQSKDEKGKERKSLIFPRYHQLDLVRALLADVREKGVGRKYLVEHSAGSGKSNSIAWLAHQLVGLQREGKALFDSVIVVTDRKVLDQQIKNTIKRSRRSRPPWATRTALGI